MVPADDQAIVFPCASVMVIIVLLKVAFTCATPEAMFLRSRRRTRAGSLPILNPLKARHCRGVMDHRFYAATARACGRPISSSRQSAWPDPYACGHWYGCVVREPGVRDDAATPGSNPNP